MSIYSTKKMVLKLIFEQPYFNRETGSFGLPAQSVRNRREYRALEMQTYECESCGYEVVMPDDVAEMFRERDYEGRENICSTCQDERAKEYRAERERENHIPETTEPIICQCGFAIEECKAGVCDGQPPKKGKNIKQGRLF